MRQLVPELLSQPGSEHNLGFHLGVVQSSRLGNAVHLSFDYRQHADEVEVSRLGGHPAFAHVHHGSLEDVGGLGGGPACEGGREELHDGGGHAGLLEVDAGCVEAAGGRVDVGVDGVGAEDMRSKGVELGGAVAEEESERDGGEGMGVGVVGGVGEDHFG